MSGVLHVRAPAGHGSDDSRLVCDFPQELAQKGERRRLRGSHEAATGTPQSAEGRVGRSRGVGPAAPVLCTARDRWH